MLDKSLLFVTVPCMIVAGLALVKGIARLIGALRVDELANLPLASGGTVDIREAGEVLLALLGKLGSTAFAGASFALHDAAGKAVPSSIIVARSLRSGLDGETTLAVRRFAIPAPGRYWLQASGFDPERIAGNSRLVLAKPGGTPLILSVLWVVTAAVALLASLVFSALSAFAQPAMAGVSVPAVGSPVRTAILDAVRGELRLASDGGSRFKVFHLKTAGPWAYFEGNEIVHVAGREWQETDPPGGHTSHRPPRQHRAACRGGRQSGNVPAARRGRRAGERPQPVRPHSPAFRRTGGQDADRRRTRRPGHRRHARTVAKYSYKPSFVGWDVQGMESAVPAGATPVSLASQLHRKNRWVSGNRYAELAEYLISKGALE